MHGREDRRRHFSATLLALALVLWAALVPSVASGAPGTDATTEVGVGSAGFLGAGGCGLGGSGTGGTDPQGSAPDEDTSHGGGATPGDAVAYDWPTGGPVGVLALFEGSATPYGPGHRGVDLAVLPGDAVLAAADGEVAFTGTVAGRGVVSIDHADGLRTTYEPLVPSVAAGDRVVAGQPIGVLARGHCPPPGCLHWGARRGTHDYVDPLGLLDDAPRPVRLLPLGSRLPALAPTPVLPTSSE
jgi:murein DD-endopeptidase MepM/ murein hydrolase activator NlpD